MVGEYPYGVFGYIEMLHKETQTYARLPYTVHVHHSTMHFGVHSQ